MAQVKKISVAKVFGKITALDLVTVVDGKPTPIDAPLFVMRVGGLATGTKDGVSDNGPWKCLVGDFVAYGARDGVEHRAPYCFLPDVALTPIVVALAQAGTQGARFMIDVAVIPDATSATGYVYTFTPVVKVAGEDPIAALLALAPPLTIKGQQVGGTLALEAPKPAPADDAPPADPAPSGEAPKAGKKGR